MVSQEDFSRTYAPLTSKGMLVETDPYNCAIALSTAYKRPYLQFGVSEGYTVPEMQPNRIEYFCEGLRRLLPIRLRATRFLVVATAQARWSAIFHNGYENPDMRVVGGVSELIRGRVIYYYSLEHSLKTIAPGERIGHMGGYAFWVFDSGKPYDPDRTLTSIRGDKRWEFEQSGDPLPFEDTKRYNLPKPLDRFNKQVMIQYFAALGLFPFDVSFYEVSAEKPAWLLEDKNVIPAFSPVADEVIRRNWYKELGLSKSEVIESKVKS
jgi:hypothetical protein